MSESCHSPQHPRHNEKAAEKRRLFRACASTACGTAGGFALAHAGCLVAPLAVAAVGLSPLLALSPLVMLPLAALSSASGLALWWKLRGQKASLTERRFTFGGAALGLAVVAAAHFAHTLPQKTPGHETSIEELLRHLPMCGGHTLSNAPPSQPAP